MIKSVTTQLLLSLLVVIPSMTSACDAVLKGNIGKYMLTHVEGVYPGECGVDCIWDFSELKYFEKPQYLQCNVDSIGQIMISGDKCINYYTFKGDTLLQVGKESPLEIISYSIPLHNMKYPIVYGDSLYREFEGEGIYCGDHLLKQKGTNKVVVDGIGSIILPDADTIKNVFRVFRQTSFYVAMDIEKPIFDDSKLKQIVEERYEWYSEKSVLPILTIAISTRFVNLEKVSTVHSSYCCLPDYFFYGDNESILYNDTTHIISDSQVLPSKNIHYDINMLGDVVSVNFNPEAEASVSMLLTNSMGQVYESKRFQLTKGTECQCAFQTNGLKPGVYVLYINIDGMVCTEKIKK